jgi:hypothetical protein
VRVFLLVLLQVINIFQRELTKAVEPYVKQEDEGKFRCKTCQKLFKATSFVEKHIANKHPDLVKQLDDVMLAATYLRRTLTLLLQFVAIVLQQLCIGSSPHTTFRSPPPTCYRKQHPVTTPGFWYSGSLLSWW